MQGTLVACRKLTPRWLASFLALALIMPATGCSDMQDNQKTVFGALGGGIVGSGACLLAHGNALACALAGVGGAVIGGAIGHVFDERDRARRDAAVQQALYDRSLWRAVPGPMASSGTGTAATPTAAIRHRSRDAAPTQVASAPPVKAWQNPDTSDSGAIVPLRTFASPATGQACKVWQEDYIKDGKQSSNTMQGCPKADGSGYDIKLLS